MDGHKQKKGEILIDYFSPLSFPIPSKFGSIWHLAYQMYTPCLALALLKP